MTDQYDKIIKIYNSKKYCMNVQSFLQFVQEKVQLDSYQNDLLKQKIQELYISQNFEQDILKLLLRLIAGIQTLGDKIKNKNKNQILKINQAVAFKSSKKSKNLQKAQQVSKQQKIAEPQQLLKKQRQSSQQKKHNNANPRVTENSEKQPLKNKNSQINEKIVKDSTQIQTQIQVQDDYMMKPAVTQKVFAQNIQNMTVKKQNQLKQIKKAQQFKPKEKQVLQNKQKQEKQNPYILNELNTIDQVENSDQISPMPKSTNQPQFLDMSEAKNEIQKAVITQYQKFSVDYINSVIKFKIQYKKKKVLRRFSEFQKLINMLRQKYEGFILPQLPPKQGIKAGMTYFWGIDQEFLNQRKKKLQQMINRLLEIKLVNQDQILSQFLTNQNFEIEYEKQGYGSYLKSLSEIVFNAKQLKDYGVAYCNYLRQKGNVKLNPLIQSKYQQIQQIVSIFSDINEYRKKINKNFDKRRQLLREYFNLQCRKPQSPSFDNKMDSIQEEIKNLTFQIDRYRQLKSQQSWINQLIRQKQNDGQKTVADLIEQQKKLEKRVEKMQQNLNHSLQQFKQSKCQKLEEINLTMIQWRQKVHP